MQKWLDGETEGLEQPLTYKCPVCGQDVVTSLYTDAWGTTARIILPHFGGFGMCRRSLTIYRQVKRHYGDRE